MNFRFNFDIINNYSCIITKLNDNSDINILTISFNNTLIKDHFTFYELSKGFDFKFDVI